jgi:hypothetical protein
MSLTIEKGVTPKPVVVTPKPVVVNRQKYIAT